MFLGGAAAGVLAAVAVTLLCLVSGDPPGAVAAAVVGTGLATAASVTQRGPRPGAGGGTWHREGAALTWTVAAMITALAVAIGLLAALAGAGWAGVAASMAAVLAALPAGGVVVILLASVRAGGAARLSQSGVRTAEAGFERAAHATMLVTGKEGALTTAGSSLSQVWAVDDDLVGLARALVLCAGDPPDAVDAAVFALARSLGLDPGQIITDLPRVAEVPFDADRRRMTTASRTAHGYLVVCQGAPEELFPLLVTSADGSSAVAGIAQPLARQWSRDGLRVTAVATTTRCVPGNAAGRLESGLRLHGLVGFADSPLTGARDAVADLADLGVGVAMVTGDHRATALVAASRVGIVSSTRGAPVATGEELRAGHWASDVRVFARVGPEQRSLLVSRWQAAGEVVAVAGHDVADLPALRRADVAIALGAGADPAVAGQADVHMATADLALVVDLILESRRALDVLRRGSGVLLAATVAVATTLAAAAVAGSAPVLTPVQVLLVTCLATAPILAYRHEPPAAAARRPSRGARRVFPTAWWCGVLGIALALLLLAALAAWWATHWQRPLAATTFAVLAAAVFGVTAAGRAGGVRGPGTRVVTGWLVAAGLVGVLLLSPPVSRLLAGQAVGLGGAVAAVLAAAVGFGAIRAGRRWFEPFRG